ncbi:hypothetical protein [Streptomonospora litoralis]|uniref:Uncharacterized protein n=1 Tax=Streptomonospora litoralis TaxID=2498135 RepID=A0A4V0ZJH2_9ACTN|nr:hypothetical protein [Streptomonospora litoralis]QBI53472.1 hypothetical protein EKD16_08390 [Streptomonospora litoralis]
MNPFRSASYAIRFGAVALLAIVALAAIAIYAFGGLARVTAGWRGEGEEIERTEADGDFRIAAYEEFYNLCTSVQDAEADIASLETELESDPPQARETQIQASLTAIRNTRAQAINDYNAAAAQEHRAELRDSDLPERLDTDAEETTCTT